MFVRYIVHGLVFVVVHNKNEESLCLCGCGHPYLELILHNSANVADCRLETTLNVSKISECRGFSDGDCLAII